MPASISTLAYFRDAETKTIPERHSQTQIVQFEDQSGLSTVRKENPQDPKRSLYSYDETRDHSLYNFLERPRNVESVTWATTDAVLTLLGSWNLPDILFSSKMNASKLSDFRFLRTKVLFRFALNANKFCTGRLIAVCEPMPALTSGNRNFQSLTSLTGYPHCFIDAGHAPTVEFEIPFISRNMAYDFKNTIQWAAVSLFVFNPLNGSSGSDTADIAVYVSAVNPDLAVPTPNDVAVVPIAHSEAQSSATSGSISGPLKTVSSVAGTVAGLGLGPVSEIGAAVAWVSEIGAKAAQAFGYSKPPNEETVGPMVQQPARNLTSYNGVDNSITLGYEARNSVAIDNTLFGSGVDEMDINYVCSRLSFIESFTWSETDAAGVVLRSFPVSPGLCGAQTTTTVTPTLLAYIAHMFRNWRGDMTYKLSFVANAFYSGRIGFAFLSGHTAITSPIDTAAIEAAPKVICDIRNSTDCVLSVPWAVNRPYLRVRLASRTSTGSNFTYANLINLNSSAGLIVVYVVNPLVMPATVPSSVQINLFSAGGSNMEFSNPTCPFYVPVSRTGPVSTKALMAKRPKESDFEPHSGSDSVPEELNTVAGIIPPNTTLLSSHSIPKDCTFAACTMGERVISLRALTRQFSVVSSGASATTEGLVMDPLYFGHTVVSPYNSRLYRIARIFAFNRGSQRYKIFYRPSTTEIYTSYAVTSYVSSSATISAPTTIAQPFPFAGTEIGYSYQYCLQTTPVLEISIPMYANDFLRVNSDANGVDRNRVIVYPLSTAANIYEIYQAAGDDFTFGFLTLSLIHI